MNSNPVVLYHGNCDDGFGSAWVVHNTYPKAECIPVFYGEEPPWEKIDDRNVYILDFAYTKQQMLDVAATCKTLTWLDHHVTNQSLAQELSGYTNVYSSFDLHRSGCILTWDYFNPKIQPPELLVHIQDNDLWRHEYSQTEPVIQALRSYKQSLSIWDMLMSHPIGQLEQDGRTLLRMHQQQVDEAFNRKQLCSLAGVDMYLTNAPKYVGSKVGHRLALIRKLDQSLFGVGGSYCQRADGKWEFSLRSHDDGLGHMFHCGNFCKKHFNGGGHAGAAGFEVVNPLDHSLIKFYQHMKS